MKLLTKKILLSIILIAAILFFYYWLSSRPPVVDKNKILSSSFILYPPEFNYRQSINNCGPFSTAAVVRALTGEDVDSEEFSEKMEWKIPRMGTFPWGMEKQLKQNNISIELPSVGRLSDDDKISFLKEQLSQKRAIIILGEREEYEHYFTLLGFSTNEDAFYVYDSFYDKEGEGMTIDTNGLFPGNRSYSTEELLDFWRGGGVFGFYKWYSIVAFIN